MKKTVLNIVVILLCALQSFAQAAKSPVIRFANIKTGTATCGQILVSPQLVDENSVFEVKSFAVTFQPMGGDTYGPYKTKGNKLTAEEISILKKLKGPRPVKITLDEITAVGEDRQPRALNSIVVNCVN